VYVASYPRCTTVSSTSACTSQWTHFVWIIEICFLVTVSNLQR
jgi:hypothetical protein